LARQCAALCRGSDIGFKLKKSKNAPLLNYLQKLEAYSEAIIAANRKTVAENKRIIVLPTFLS
jgi:hypothetical protein